MYKVYDDVITSDEAEALMITFKALPFYFLKTENNYSSNAEIQNKWSDKNTVEAKVMQHEFMQDGEILSNDFGTIEILLKKFLEKSGEKFEGLNRCKLNLQFQNKDYDVNKYQCPHKDQDFEHHVLIYYPFTSDGDTILFKEIANKEYEIIDRIKPVGGRFLFMSNQFHASQPPMKNETRMTLNYNLRKHG